MIVWLGIKKPPQPYSPTQPPRKGRRSLPQPLRREGSASSQVFCRKLSDKEPSPYPSCAHRHSPPFGGVGGGFCISLCKTDSYEAICRTCYSSTPKNDCFLNKVAYLCKQRTEAPPDLPEPTVTDRREVKGRRQVCKYFAEIIWKKSQKSLSSYVRIGTPPPSGRLGGAPSPRERRSADREIAPKVSEVSARMLRDKRS